MTSVRKQGSVSLLGVRIEQTTTRDVAQTIEEMIDEGGFHQVATANVNFLINAQRDAELKRVLTNCDLVVADGMPVVWISRILGQGIVERVTGVDLIPMLATRATERGWGIYLLGSNENHLKATADVLTKQNPGLRIVGSYAPPYATLSQMDHEGILQRIEATSPDLLLVAFGNPKQELFLAMHRERLKVPVAIGVGGSFELIGGFLKRAPNWMQKTGLEWVYRILREPRRLLGRYVRDGFVLTTTLPRQLIAICLRRRSHAGMAIEVEHYGSSAVVYMTGELSGSMLPVVIEEVDALLRTHTPVVMDASRVEFLDGDGVGMLMRLQHLAMKYHTPYWIAGMNRRTEGILEASRSQRNLPLADSVAQALRRIRVGMGMSGELDSEHKEKFTGEPVGNTVVR